MGDDLERVEEDPSGQQRAHCSDWENQEDGECHPGSHVLSQPADILGVLWIDLPRDGPVKRCAVQHIFLLPALEEVSAPESN